MPNGQDSELDQDGCGFGQRLEMRTNFQDEKLDDIKITQEKILAKVEEIKEQQDKNTPYNNMWKTFMKYIIAALVGGLASLLGLVFNLGG